MDGINEHMALFTRRVLQQCLDENASFASEENLSRWVKQLNKVSKNYLADEWEVVLLRAFARFGTIRHEPPLGESRLDLVFESADGTLEFAADIAAISDESLHENNPIDKFSEELRTRILEARVETGRFIFQVQEQQPVAHERTGTKRKLLLPPVEQFASHIFDADFNTFIESIQRSPQEQREHHVRHLLPATDLTIQYQPGNGRGVGSASFGSYTSTTVEDSNPLFNRLKEKAERLRKSGYAGMRGIIICDRGSRIFNEMPNWAVFTMQEVVNRFLAKNNSVAFVITIGIKAHSSPLRGEVHRDFEPKLFVRDRSESWVRGLDSLLVKVVSSLPAVYQTPENAINILKWNQSAKRTRPYLGGSVLKGNEIRISSRELLDLLAGKLDQKRFSENHEMSPGKNIFSLYKAREMMITRARVERRPEEDDDWVVLEFGADDPAVSNFRMPSSEKPLVPE